MGRTERDKGAAAERDVARVFRDHGFDLDRTPNSGALRIKGDLYGNVPAHIEVKRQETLRLPLWLRQAAAEAPPGVTPVVAFRQNRGAWYAALPLDCLAALLARQLTIGVVDQAVPADAPGTDTAELLGIQSGSRPNPTPDTGQQGGNDRDHF